MATEFATYDETEFPLVKVTFNYRDPDVESFKRSLSETKRILQYKKPFAVLMDARKLGFLSSEIRIAQGLFFKENANQLKLYCLGAVILVSSPIVKMMVKAMMLIAPPPNTTIISADSIEARKYAEALLTKNEHLLSTAEKV